MEKVTIRDVVQDVINPPNNKSFEELEADVARRASDDAEASSLLKKSIMSRFVPWSFHDIMSERLMMKMKKEEKKEKEKEKEEEEKSMNMKKRKEVDFFVPKNKRFTKCSNNNNNNEEKGTVEVIKNPKNCNNNDKDQKDTMIVKNKKPKKKINCTRKNLIGLESEPVIPIKMRKYIEDVLGGSDIKLFIMKKIFWADLEPHNNRISIPKNQVKDHSVLTEEEKEFIKINNDDDGKKAKEQNKPGLMVTLLEPARSDQPTMEEQVQYLKTWNMNSTAYVLTHKWNSFVERHQDVLKVDTIVQLWSFRRQQQQQQSDRVLVKMKTPLLQTNLSFALIIVDETKGDGASTSGCGGGDLNHHMIKNTSSPESVVTDQGAKD
ncbi:hypothetical protein Dsin_021254 [Dipteronia sinensis]|uniref:B3 domain-containing protein n=1 Tax=Dipteronia sinensis TaxID=43782 RepID=A0AAD9ZZF2_9ROSI|nr:hypothetical protein Dsin_021254 [Dipteronia sinensis]